MALKISLILLFVLLLSKSLFVNTSPVYRHDSDNSKVKCDIAKNSHEPKGLPTDITPPDSATFKFFLHASGVQIYKCDASTKTWNFVEPKADLFIKKNNKDKVGEHSFQPLPLDPINGGGRATWNSTLDCDHSGVVTKIIKSITPSTENIPWLLTQATRNEGKNGAFSDVTHVVRINTEDGIAPPADKCNTDGSIFKSYYTAEYWFFH